LINGCLLDPDLVGVKLGYEPVDVDPSFVAGVEIVSARVRGYVGWRIGRVHDGDGSPIAIPLVVTGTAGVTLDTGIRPLNTVESVSIDGRTLVTGEYRWTRTGRMWRQEGWGDAFTSVELLADVGYDSCPYDLATVVVSACARWLANPVGLRAQSAGNQSTDGLESGETRTYADPVDGFTIGERAILDRYRPHILG
jgi:hypothetical protein